METQLGHSSGSDDPLDIVEQVVIAEQFAYERSDDGELHVSTPGAWQEHHIWFAWSPSVETLHVCLGADVKAPAQRRADVCDLIARLNERLWLGHFDIWADDGAIVYRHALVLPTGARLEAGQVAAMLAAAVEAGERFYPAFNFLMWAGKSPDEAVSAALFETVGEA